MALSMVSVMRPQCTCAHAGAPGNRTDVPHTSLPCPGWAFCLEAFLRCIFKFHPLSKVQLKYHHLSCSSHRFHFLLARSDPPLPEYSKPSFGPLIQTNAAWPVSISPSASISALSPLPIAVTVGHSGLRSALGVTSSWPVIGQKWACDPRGAN